MLWDYETGECVRTFKGHGQEITGITIIHNNSHFASSSFDYSIIVWDLDSGKSLYSLLGHNTPVTCLTSIPNNN